MTPPAMTAVPTNQSSSTATASATSVVQTSSDSLFEPTVEMMVNDFDDERTLEEEEALAVTEDPSTELSNLERVRLRFLFN